MMKSKMKHSIWFESIAIGVVCLLLVNNMAMGGNGVAAPGVKETFSLQVPSNIKPITQNAGASAASLLHDPDRLISSITAQFHTLSEMNKLPSPVTIMGALRFSEQTELYQAIRSLGGQLSLRNIPRRTGAGSGVMEAALLVKNGDDSFKRQGVNLSRYDDTNLSVDVVVTFDDPVLRNRGLFGNSRAAILCPGGFGTIYEVWGCLAEDLPVVLFESKFWEPIIECLKEQFSRIGIKFPEERFLVTDSTEKAVEHVANRDPRSLQVDENLLRDEVETNINHLSKLPPGIVFIGEPSSEGHALETSRKIARHLLQNNCSLRIASKGALFENLAELQKTANGENTLQAILRFSPDDSAERDSYLEEHQDMEIMTPTDISLEHIMITENAQGFVFLPGGPDTMFKLFSLFERIRNGSIPKKPVVLVGKDFWEDIVTVLKRQMLDLYDFQITSPEYFDFLRIVDSEEEALSMLEEADIYPASSEYDENFRWLFNNRAVLELLKQKGAINVAYATLALHGTLERYCRVNFPYMFSNDEMLLRFRPPESPQEQMYVRCYDPRTKEPSQKTDTETINIIPISNELCIEVLRKRKSTPVSAYELMVDRYDSYYRMGDDPLVVQNMATSRRNILDTAARINKQGTAVITDAGRLYDIQLKRLLSMRIEDEDGRSVFKFKEICLADINDEDIEQGLRRFDLSDEERSRIKIVKTDLSLICSGLARHLEAEKKKRGELNLATIKDLVSDYVERKENWEVLPFNDDSVSLFVSSGGITSFYGIFARYINEHILSMENVPDLNERKWQICRELIFLSKKISQRFLEEASRITSDVIYVAGCVENESSKGTLIGVNDLFDIMSPSLFDRFEGINSMTWLTRPITSETFSIQAVVLMRKGSETLEELKSTLRYQVLSSLPRLNIPQSSISQNSFCHVSIASAFLEQMNRAFQDTHVGTERVVMLVPTNVMNESQKKWKTYFNKLSDAALRKEKLHILDVEGLPDDERREKISTKINFFKSEGYKVIVAVNDERIQSELIEREIESLTFKGGVDLYFILTCLRALHRKRVDLLVYLYGMLIGSGYQGNIPVSRSGHDFNEFLKNLIFEIPDADRMDYDIELESHNNRTKQLILSA
jgi:predicted Rossmann-fold nucleotide-binding protein